MVGQSVADKSAAKELVVEIADNVETAKTIGTNEETRRRALRMKVARLTANPISAPIDCKSMTLDR